MALDSNIVGAVTGTGADVNADRELKTTLTQDVAKAGFVVNAGEAHDGAAGVARIVRPVDVSHDYRTRIGIDNCVFSDTPGLGTTVPLASKYRTSTTTMTCSGANGALVINNANSTASTAHVRTSTHAHFSVPPASSLYTDITFAVSAAPATNQVIRIGRFKQQASASADTDCGAYIELSAAGAWQGCVMIAPGSSATVVPLTGFTPVSNKYHLALIVESQYEVDFYIDGVCYGTVARPDASPDMTVLGGLPLSAYLSNGASGVASALQLRIGKWGVTMGDLDSQIDHDLRMALSANSAHSASGAAGAIISNITNSAAPSSATLSNTVAGYTTIDGNFQWAAVAGAETDYCLFGHTVPDSSISQPGKSLIVTGATISLRNQGAANSATVPTTVEFYYACGSTAVSLAASDSATGGTRSPRRQYLGQIMIPVNAVIGQAGDREINVDFPAMLTEPANFSHIIAKIVSGAATASQIIRGHVALKKKWTE